MFDDIIILLSYPNFQPQHIQYNAKSYSHKANIACASKHYDKLNKCS